MALHPNPLSKVYLTGVVKERPDQDAWRAQYIGNSLLPMRPVGAYKLAWDVVQSENNLAGIYAINGRPIPGSELLFAERFQEVKNIMTSRTMHPQDVMILREPGQPAVGTNAWNMKSDAQAKVKLKIAACDDEVDAQVEYMQLQAMQGSLTWPPEDADGNPITTLMPQWGNVQLVVNFPTRGIFRQAATTLVGYAARTGGAKAWSDTSSNPLLDLEVIAELISETIGVKAHGSRIIMGSGLLSRLCFNADIIGWIKGTEQGVKMVDKSQLIEFIKTRLGYTIQEYAARWTYRSDLDSPEGPTINSVGFLDRMRMLIIPPGVNVGYFASAPSPDGKYKSGKYTWVISDQEPPWETRVGEGLVGFPVLERADQIFILDADS